MGIQKGLPYTCFMNHEITKLRGSGMLQLFFLRHASKTPTCNYSDGNDNTVVSLSIQKIVFLFVIILLGMVLSVKIFAVEKIISYCQASNQKTHGRI